MWELVLLGLALSAAGAGAQIAGSQESSSAMNQAMSNELATQQQFQKQATNVFQTSLGQSSPTSAQADMAKGQQLAMNQYQKLENTPLSGTSAPAPFGSSSAQNINAGQKQLSNTAQANLQGYSEWDLQQAIKDLTAKGQLGVIGAQSANAASILPYQLQAASQAGSDLTGIGSLLGAAGGVVGGIGAVGGGWAGLLGELGDSGIGTAGSSWGQGTDNLATSGYYSGGREGN